MRNFFIFLLLLSLTGCDTDEPNTDTNETATAAQPPLTFGTSYDKLLEKFTEISFDTLAVSPPDLGKGDSPFMGTGLDSAMTALLPTEITGFYSSFAISRFTLDGEVPEKAKAIVSKEYYLLDIKPEATDTLSKNSTLLLQTYGHLLRKPA